MNKFDTKPVKKSKISAEQDGEAVRNAFAEALSQKAEKNNIGMRMSQPQTVRQTVEEEGGTDQVDTSLVSEVDEKTKYVLLVENDNRPDPLIGSGFSLTQSGQNINKENKFVREAELERPTPVYIFRGDAVLINEVEDFAEPQLVRVPFLYNFAVEKYKPRFPLFTPLRNTLGRPALGAFCNGAPFSIKTVNSSELSTFFYGMDIGGRTSFPVIEYDLTKTRLKRITHADEFFEHSINQLNRMTWMMLAALPVVLQDMDSKKQFFDGANAFDAWQMFSDGAAMLDKKMPDGRNFESTYDTAVPLIKDIMQGFAIVDQARIKWGQVIEQNELKVADRTTVFSNYNALVNTLYLKIMSGLDKRIKKVLDEGRRPYVSANGRAPRVSAPMTPAQIAAANSMAAPSPAPSLNLSGIQVDDTGGDENIPVSVRLVLNVVADQVKTVLSQELHEIFTDYNDAVKKAERLEQEFGDKRGGIAVSIRAGYLSDIQMYICGNPYRHFLIFRLVMNVSSFVVTNDPNAYLNINLPDMIFRALLMSGNLQRVLVQGNHRSRNERIKRFLETYDSYLDQEYMYLSGNFYDNILQIVKPDFAVAMSSVYADIQEYTNRLKKMKQARGIDFLFSNVAVDNGSIGLLASILIRQLVLLKPSAANDTRPEHRTRMLEDELSLAWEKLRSFIDLHRLLD